jgi:nicotinamide riboside kinase
MLGLRGLIAPQNNVLWGLIPCLTKSCGISDLADKVRWSIKPLGTTFKHNYFREFETEFKNILGYEFGNYMESIRGKNQRAKISCYYPFKTEVCIHEYLHTYIPYYCYVCMRLYLAAFQKHC